MQAPRTAICNGKVYDFFVVSADLADMVVGVHVISDAGMHPHSPVRMVIKGKPRKTMVRQLQAPTPVPAVLPHGPMAEPPPQPDLVQAYFMTTAERYASLTDQTTDVLTSLAGTAQHASDAAPPRSWKNGPAFVWRNVANPPASDRPNSTPISRAWRRTTSWLRTVLANKSRNLVKSATWRLLYYDHRLVVHDEQLLADAAAFKAWRDTLTVEALESKLWIKAFIDVADNASKVADSRAANRSAKHFTEWLREGPAAGLKRQHLFIRTATGWTDSKVGNESTPVTSELDDLEGLSPEQLQAACSPTTSAQTPLGAQHLANAELADWGIQWAVGSNHDKLDWPDITEPLPPISLKKFRDALFSFPAGTGLGWDALHPRAMLRLPDELLRRWIDLFEECEAAGSWPEQIGVVIVVLIPKPEGGFRPIGLLPNPPRIWMRLRREQAKQWEVKCDRPFLYAGSGRGSTVAAWKQSLRAELAAATHARYAQLLLDLVKAFERIPYRVLLREANRLRYPLRLIRLAIATYKLPRVVRVGTAFSDIIFAVRGIVAGSGLATIEMRLVMVDIVDAALTMHPDVEPTLFVDDLSAEVVGDASDRSHNRERNAVLFI